MDYTITINCDNAAFEENPAIEISRILKEFSERLSEGALLDCKIRDVNGNVVGFAKTIDYE